MTQILDILWEVSLSLIFRWTLRMDPLTALGIAANIWAFVDVGIKVTNQARQLYKSGQETTAEVAAIDASTQSLDFCVKKLQSSSNCPDEFRDLLRQTQSSSKELHDILTKVKIKNPKSRREYIKVSWRLCSLKSDMASLQNRLGDLRSQVMLSQLNLMKDETSDLSKKLDDIQKSVRDLSPQRWIEFKDTREAVVRLLNGQYAQDLVKNVRVLEQTARQAEIESKILSLLRFEVLQRRRDLIWDANYGTFAWMLDQGSPGAKESTRTSQTREAFITWLESGKGVFHVSGKAGAGKSVLMKLLASHPETRRHLNIWADGSNLCTASFFFYNDGSIEEKSLEGMYRSVLYAVLNERPSLMSIIFPDWFQSNHTFRDDQLSDLIRPYQLKVAFRRFLDIAKEAEYKICLFIDGLDEFEGDATDHREFAEQLKTWSGDANAGRVKFCVSSRPHDDFIQAFAPAEGSVGPQIHLQELTRPDIERYSTETFKNSRDWEKLTVLKAEYEDMVRVIVRRAEGVFLWAHFVVRIILTEARRKGTAEDLWRTLEKIPDKVDGLYERLLGAIKPADREFTNKILFTVLTNPFRSSLSIMCLNWLRDNETWNGSLRSRTYTAREASDAVERAICHLHDWTGGLVELERRDHGDESDIVDKPDADAVLSKAPYEYFNNRVRLFHQTVVDYLKSGPIIYELKQSMSSVNMAEFHAGLRLAEIRCGSKPVSRDEFSALKLAYRGYRLLSMHFDEQLVSDSEIAWPFYEALVDFQPTYCPFSPFRINSSLPIDFLVTTEYVDLKRIDRNITKAYFAAFLGFVSLPICMNELEMCVRDKRQRSEPKQKSRNMLLSACHGYVMLNDIAIHRRRFVREDTIAVMIQKGMSGSDSVGLQCSEGGMDYRPYATVWSFTVSSLACLSRPVKSKRFRYLLDVVGKLLKLEKQEELLFLGGKKQDRYSTKADRYTHFMTLRDRMSSVGAADKTLMELLDDWPDYSESYPDWLHRWDGRTLNEVANELTILRASELGEIELSAVVTRTSFLEHHYFLAAFAW